MKSVIIYYSKVELEEEKTYFAEAIEKAKKAEVVLIGTPTEFRKPHPKAMKFIDKVEAKRVAIFCTYYGMLGATFINMVLCNINKGCIN